MARTRTSPRRPCWFPPKSQDDVEPERRIATYWSYTTSMGFSACSTTTCKETNCKGSVPVIDNQPIDNECLFGWLTPAIHDDSVFFEKPRAVSNGSSILWDQRTITVPGYERKEVQKAPRLKAPKHCVRSCPLHHYRTSILARSVLLLLCVL